MATYSDDDILESLHEIGFNLQDPTDIERLREDVNYNSYYEPVSTLFHTQDEVYDVNVEQIPRLISRLSKHSMDPELKSALEWANDVYQKSLKATELLMDDFMQIVDEFAADKTNDSHLVSLLRDETVPTMESNRNAGESNPHSSAALHSANELYSITEVPENENNLISKPLPTAFRIPPALTEKQFIDQNGLKRVACPAPGRLPLQHDNLKRLQKYREEWAKNPPPGENSRRQLRWKVRTALLRRDIPIISMRNRPTDVQQHRPDWQE
ncbi:hypothetical protein M3Y94_00158100 [Aphelenchoides besseyi]|nr:hypothetical protein M3Y94_00158100 [Aphelenchoides besseyi]KAI6237099.1 hypothetical protein M3Y95_00229400 [Aphelenchoides besseyi]